MELDFSKCKTKEDVDKVFDENFKEIKTLHHVAELIKKCIDAGNNIRNKKIEKQVNE